MIWRPWARPGLLGRERTVRKEEERRRGIFNRRAALLGAIQLGAFGFLGSRLYRLQIEEGAVGSNGAGTTILGSIFANEMIGNSGTNIMFGLGGADTYRAGDGLDYVYLVGVTTSEI